ncbi:MAG: ferrous iron transport protein B, partial [Oscillospiraceae bacterium]|nr:ferrous iron transport protein B [Oscillospiraceae bacterium]
MGLTTGSVGKNACDSSFTIQKNEEDFVIALAGNPNVGKSTVFNALTGMKQHTGNWTGKTVQNAQGRCVRGENSYVMVDIPGTYSLLAHSAEEVVARDFICFGGTDAVIVVCDASCLERNLNLVLQTIEITEHTLVCVNLMDEAEKKKISVNLETLSKRLGVPVCGAAARNGIGIEEMMELLPEAMKNPPPPKPCVVYPNEIEIAIDMLIPALKKKLDGRLSLRWTAIRLLDRDEQLNTSISDFLGFDISSDREISAALNRALNYLSEQEISSSKLNDMIVTSIVRLAERYATECTIFEKPDYYERDRKIDRILTHKIWGVPIMAAMLLVIFWITIEGANYPSDLLFGALFSLGDKLSDLMVSVGSPEWLRSMLIDGMYRVLAWVTAVMLPPMAIFFPMFTILEDVGYLPRVAFNLDRYFKKANACGKQALTMAMGFGCNAAGVTGCRIIDSPRERLIAMLTNNFVPCNGRFPTLIAVITMFMTAGAAGLGRSFLSVLILTLVIILGVFLTFLMSRLLSATVLKGVPSSFALELPPYRRPQIGKVIVRSIFDRTIFVLGRAVAVAAPAGLVIWLLGNITVDGSSLLTLCAGFLDPFARFIGLDGVILLAFILGFPANEIVVPIMLMVYMGTEKITNYESLSALKQLLTDNGWTIITAVCTVIFMLCHFPCSTTCMTVKKETGSLKWTAAAFLLPLAAGIVLCAVIANIMRLF